MNIPPMDPVPDKGDLLRNKLEPELSEKDPWEKKEPSAVVETFNRMKDPLLTGLFVIAAMCVLIGNILAVLIFGMTVGGEHGAGWGILTSLGSGGFSILFWWFVFQYLEVLDERKKKK